MINYKEKLAPVKAFVFDFDGVMTNGDVWTYGDGETVRCGNIKDGFAIQYAVKKGYTIAVISGATSKSIDNRMRSLGVEQVFTGFIFFYDDWVQEPLSSREGFELVNELHSGATLRIFPHLQGEDIIWYAPNSNIPEHVPSEHRRYMHDVFSRLNGEVQAGNWSTVDAYIDRMIQYQCQFGGEKVSVPVSSEFLVSISAFILVVFLVSRLLFVNLCRNKN